MRVAFEKRKQELLAERRCGDRRRKEYATRREVAVARILYKRKGLKVQPVDEAHAGGKRPAGDADWRQRRIEREISQNAGRYSGYIVPKFSTIQRGSRLTSARIAKMEIGKSLTPEERELLLEVLFNREAAIAFKGTEKGRFHDGIEPPHVIPTIPHKAWQIPSFRIPAALQGASVRILKDRLECGTIERSSGPYRNPWFLVEKHGFERDEGGNLIEDATGKPMKRYRLINSAQRVNAVTIRDASLPPSVDDFSEQCSGYIPLAFVS
jgi:hypothetical protein